MNTQSLYVRPLSFLEDFFWIAARGFNALRCRYRGMSFEPQNTPHQPCIDMVEERLSGAEERPTPSSYLCRHQLPDGQDSIPEVLL